MNLQEPHFVSEDKMFTIYKGDCLEILPKLTQKADIIFADPPYFLSQGGNTIQNGKIVSVNKGEWDENVEYEAMNSFNNKWIESCRQILKDDGTIWITGTFHNIFSIIHALKINGFKILNVITWQKSNPPPNFYKKIFHQTVEYIVFARKSQKVTHTFNYELLFNINNKRMSDVWTLPAVQRWEKKFGNHPTQKPLNVLFRILLSVYKEGDIVIDPFSGSGTTGIASNILSCKYIGIENSEEYIEYSVKRKIDILDNNSKNQIISKIKDLNILNKINNQVLFH